MTGPRLFTAALMVFTGLLAGAGTPALAEKIVPVTITLSTKGNDVSFDQTSLQVPHGATIHLTFMNAATSDSAIDHNVAILRPGTEDKFIRMMADESYDMEKIQTSEMILAKTKILPPGGKDTLTFKAPRKGYYTYICLVPGHGNMLGMKGILSVR